MHFWKKTGNYKGYILLVLQYSARDLKNVTIVIKNIQIHMPWRVFFFLDWKFAQMWKNKMEREYLVTFFIKKKVIRFAKN